MHRKPFREHHLLQLMESYSQQPLPIDVFLRDAFRKTKQLGSKDRKYITEKAYQLIRWQGLIDYCLPEEKTWENRIENLKNFDPISYQEDRRIPPWVRSSFPKPYFDLVVKDYGLEKALEFCRISNERAPMTIRVNPLKISREELFDRWQSSYPVRLCEKASLGITFLENIPCLQTPEYKEGLFEIQDEGSQLIADLLQIKPGDHVLDYCAGAGGKSLAFGHFLEGKGQLYVHDIRKRVIDEARKRFARSGIQNVQFFVAEEKRLKRFTNKMDWVLADVPCSGSGTLRRNPDLKWKTGEKTFAELQSQQEKIVQDSLKYLKSGGKLVYSTCSIFSFENEEMIAELADALELTILETVKWTPVSNGQDGFFAAVLQKN